MTPEWTPDNDSDGIRNNPVDAGFLIEVMEALRDTNFAHGWVVPGMYDDFLAWCEHSEAADEIISEHYDEFPVLVLDEEENLRVIGVRSQVAAALMKDLLEAFEQQRVRSLLNE
ncbi:MAG TPA: hypothetical protein VGM51_10470 [Armatimonadota bacterium]|jgi:hypothetical protein